MMPHTKKKITIIEDLNRYLLICGALPGIYIFSSINHIGHFFVSFFISPPPILHFICILFFPTHSSDRSTMSHSLSPTPITHSPILFLLNYLFPFSTNLTISHFMDQLNIHYSTCNSHSIRVSKEPTFQFSRRLKIQHQLLGRGPTLLFTYKAQPSTTQFPEMCLKDTTICYLSRPKAIFLIARANHLR
jgi:hypothetical protein